MSETRHLHWGAEALWRQLEPLLPGLAVEVAARCESTNSQLLERIREGAGRASARSARRFGLADDDPVSGFPPFEQPAAAFGRRQDDTRPCLLVAEHQTRGRGRQGRLWQSSAGASLTFSLALPLSPRDWSGLSLAVGIALADALDPPQPGGGSAPRLGLKWPNDLWLLDAPGCGRKLGGVLIETVAVGARRMAVVGVGLNVLPQPTVELSQGFACLQEIDAAADAPGVLRRLARPLVADLQRFEDEGFAAFAARFAARDVLRGREVQTTAAEAPGGVAEGVAADGALLLRTAAGVLRLSSAEVSVRLDPHPIADGDAGPAP